MVTGGNGTARHQHDFTAVVPEAGNLSGPVRKRRVIEALTFVRDQTRAELDDEPLRVC